MTWQTQVEKVALLELLARGQLKRRRAQSSAFDALAELPWTRATGRRDEIAVVDARRGDLLVLLDRVWPEWREALVALTERGLPPTPDGWSHLEDARRVLRLPSLPELLNQRTAAGITASHSKATLTATRRAALGDTQPTRDGSVRLRPPRGLTARTRRGRVDLAEVADVLGEVAIPERALLDGFVFEGAIRAVLLVENLGAWRDLPTLEGWIFAHVPGWDTATVSQLLTCVQDSTVIHFGDLDPNGVRIFAHLRERRTDLRWFVPSFWGELLETHGLRSSWPDDLELREAPSLVRELAERSLWLEQEPLVVDPRIGPALEAML